MDQKMSSFKTISHINLLTVSVNKIIFFRSKMGQTQHKLLRTRNFHRFCVRNCSLHLERIFFQIITRNKAFFCTSNIQLQKFLKSKTKCRLFTKAFFFQAVRNKILWLMLKNRCIKKKKMRNG